MPEVNLNQNPQTTQTPQKPERNWKKISLFLLIGLFLLSLVGVGIYLLIPKLVEEPQPESEKQATSSAKPATSSAKKDEMEDWKTYINTEAGYTIKYPADWTIKEDKQSINLEKEGNKISIVWNPGGVGLEGYDIEPITIDGVSTQKATYKQNNLVDQILIGNIEKDYSKTPEKDSYLILFKAAQDFKNNEEVINIFNKILSTFKFLD